MFENAQIMGKPVGVLSERQRNALVKLLDDEDPQIYEHIRKKIIECGPEIVKLLKPLANSENTLLRTRASEIIYHFLKEDADSTFLAFCLRHGDNLDLEQGIWLLAKTQYPDLNQQAYQALIDAFAIEIAQRLKLATRGISIINTINVFMFDELRFSGNEQDYYNPDNSFMNKVLDNRVGNPVSLCSLYILLAQRLKLPIVGISLPGHFMCRFQTSVEEFYIDVFNRGRILTKSDCIRYLRNTNRNLHEGFLAPVCPRSILLRMCSNLHQIYQQREQLDLAEKYQRYLVALAK